MKKTIHIVSYSHWDREFRFDFESTRMRLVDLMDNLIDIMTEQDAFRHFMLDGQYILLEDYLSIRPEKEGVLRDFASNGRLATGPWYTLPDSSCVHGESLIRNLMTGLRKARAFGGALEVGYNVFSFGQIAQLPQIYAGFGIDEIVFYKHMRKDRSRHPEFLWEAPDGSRAFATRLGSQARWNFFFAGHIPIVYGQDPWDKDWQYEWGSLGKVFHMCETENYASFHDILQPETSFDKSKVLDGFQRTLETVKDSAAQDHLLFFDGTDFTEPHPCTPAIIEAAREVLGDDYTVVHSTLSDYVAAIRKSLSATNLDVVTGEMRDGPVGSVHSDVCSIHPELKRANSLAENLLFRWAEPFASQAWLLGNDYPKAHFQDALEYLFKAQAHDSLHGVGPADMALDVANRLLQAKSIAEGTAVRAFQGVACSIDTQSSESGDQFVVIYNPSSFARTEVVEAHVDVPIDDRSLNGLRLLDSAGEEVPIHVLSSTRARAGLYHPRSRNMPIYCTRFHVLIEARDVPPLGYKTLVVAPVLQSLYPYPHDDWDPLLIPYESLITGASAACNDHVCLEIGPDGTLTVADRATGRIHSGLNYFVDCGECGNLYAHVPPAVDSVVSTKGVPARVSRIIDSPLMARFKVETSLEVPVGLDLAAGHRSNQTVCLNIATTITLRKYSRVVEIEGRLDNRARDHFLRAYFPTGISSDVAHVDANFELNSYPARPARDGNFRGQALSRNRMHLFVDLSDGEGGLALLNQTLRDYEVVDADSGTVALSIVRGVPLRIPCDNRLWMEYPGDDSAQSLGQHEFRYGIYLHSGDWDCGNVYSEALAFSTPLRAAQIGKHSGALPLTNSFMELRGDGLVLSAVKKSEERDSIIVRIFNPTTRDVQGSLAVGHSVSEAFVVNLNEERSEKLPVTGASVIEFTATPKRIVSIEWVPVPSE